MFIFSLAFVLFDEYTCRAVVWTDFIQFVLIMTSIIAVIFIGTEQVGGFSNVWAAAERGQRLIVFKYELPFNFINLMRSNE